MNRLTRQVVLEAEKHVGVKEAGHNDGPEIRGWLRRVHRQPGAPWCAAFAWCMLDDACRSLGLKNPIPPTAGVHLLVHIVAKEHHARSNEPGPGFIFGIDHGLAPDGVTKLGHCGIVIEVGPLHIVTVEGNTNEAGGREGNCVAIKTRRIADCALGFLDPGLLLVGEMCHPDHPEYG